LKVIGRTHREITYLSFVVATAIVFSLFCIAVNLTDTIASFLRVYREVPHADVFFNLVFAYLCVLIWVLYRSWRRAVRRENELEEVISSISPYGLLVLDADNRVVECNSAVSKMFGYGSGEAVDPEAVQSLLNPKEGEGSEHRGFAETGPFRIDSVSTKKANGETIHLEVITRSLADSKGKVVLLNDVTERKKAQESLKRLTEELAAVSATLDAVAKQDPLTGLLNQKGLAEVLDLEIRRSLRHGSRAAAILVDCDDLKRINATFGHSVGDVVLAHIGARLKDSLRSTDFIGRVGGDEFLVILPETRLAEAVSVAEKLRRAVSWCPLPLSSEQVEVTAWMGVTSLPRDVISLDEILSVTRQLVERSKAAGKDRISSAGGPPDRGVEVVVTSTGAIDRLLAGDCFYPVCQPIVRLGDEQVVGYELLGRCSVPGLEMPGEFFSFSLEHNILSYVDLQCLKACLAGADSLRPRARVHLNLFPSTVLATPVASLLKAFPGGMEPGSFCIELCEQQFISDTSYFKQYMLALKEAGILIALDDLGFGRSSLESLIVLEPDVVKIDRTYVDGISRDEGRRRSLKRLVGILGAVGAECIAEGIETREDLSVLIEMGIPYGQGYLWGRPARIEKLGPAGGGRKGPPGMPEGLVQVPLEV